MYKVSEVAKICGVTQSAIYKIIKQVDKQFINLSNGRTMITDEGLEYFKDRFSVTDDVSTGDENIISSLLDQLAEKDRQLAEKDKQISLLLEQSKNFQILLKAEQDKNISALPVRSGFWSRFRKKDN